MKITRLQAENFKRIKLVDITPDDTMQVVSGRNAQGKTSLLDSFLMALQYATGKKVNFSPVRDGEEKAVVRLELSEGGQVKFNLTHTFTAAGKHELVLESPEGARYSGPQKILDDLIGNLSMDPLAFANSPAKEQLATLLELVELPFDPAVIAGQRQTAYDARTEVNRRIKTLSGQIAGMKVPPAGLPATEISSADVLAELRKAESARAHHGRVLADRDALQVMVAELKEKLAQAEQRLSDVEGQLDTWPALADTDALQEKLTNLEITNALIREGQRRAETVTAKEALDAEAAAFTAKIDGLDQVKTQGLAAAVMPLDGLGFDDDGVTYQGQPFAQASGAEKLRVSFAMAMALNPTLRVIRITDGSLLDSTNMALLEDMARDKDFQVWVERVDGAVGIVIEDGEIVA